MAEKEFFKTYAKNVVFITISMILVYVLFAFYGLAISKPESGAAYGVFAIATVAFWALIIRGWRLGKKNDTSLNKILKLKNDLSKSINALIYLVISATVLSWIILYFAGTWVLENDKMYALIFLVYSVPFFAFSLWKSYKVISGSQ